jgi:hypothetical protein
MLELHANNFLYAATELARMKSLVLSSDEVTKTELLLEKTVTAVKPRLEAFGREATKVGAKVAWRAANRLYLRLEEKPCNLTWGALGLAFDDIESRFSDELTFVKLFVIPEERTSLFEGADKLLKPETAAMYSSVWFDCEEAAKCLCLGRSTASVFHSMRMLEIAIGAISKRLKIPDPTKVDRSWGRMLNAIKEKMDQLHPKKQRTSSCEGGRLEQIYVSLDAVKNPWRNGTMHVESVYTEEEARHILVCTSHLLDKMALIFDENGDDVPAPTTAMVHSR